MAAVDQVLEIVRVGHPTYRLAYNRHFIGLNDGARAQNFVIFRPRRKHVEVGIRLANLQDWRAKAGDVGLDARVRERVLIRLAPGEVGAAKAFLQEAIAAAGQEHDE